MEVEDRQRKRDIREIFKERPKLYKCPLPKKRQRVIAKAEEPGEVKVFSEEEIFLYKIKEFEKDRQERRLYENYKM